MTLQEPEFWTRQLPLSIFLGLFVVGVICSKLQVLHRYVSLKLRLVAVLGGLAGIATVILISKFTAPDKATLFIYSEKPAEVQIFMDGQPVKLKDLSGATLVPLTEKGPNLLEVRESGEVVVKQAVKKERYVVNCSATRTTACECITYTTDRLAARVPSLSGNPYLFRDFGRGILKIELPETETVLEFSEKPPLSLPLLKRKDPDKHQTREAWWLHAE